MAGKSAPHITAVIDADDLLTPKIQHLEALLKSFGATGSTGIREMDAALKSVEADFAKIVAQAAKVKTATAEAFAVGPVRQFGEAAAGAAKQVDALGSRLAHARAETGRLREALSGVGGMIGGTIVVEAAKGASREGARLEHQRVAMRAGGMMPDQITDAERRAEPIARDNPILTKREIIRLDQQLRTVLRHPEEVPEMLPVAARAKAALKAAHPEYSEHEVDNGVEAMIKAAEMEGGARDPETLKAALDAKLKALNYQPGLIKSPEEFLNAAKQGGGALAITSDQFKNDVLPLMIAEMGGHRAGTFVNAVSKTAAGDFENQSTQLAHWIEAGLIKREDVEFKRGKPWKLRQGADRSTLDELGRDPYAWLKKHQPEIAEAAERRAKAGKATAAERSAVLDEAVEGGKSLSELAKEKGVTVDDHLFHELQELRRLYPNAVAARGMMELRLQTAAIDQHIEQKKSAQGIDAAANIRADPLAALVELRTSLEAFGAALTSPAMKSAASMLDDVAHGFAALTSQLEALAKSHPDAARRLGEATMIGGVVGGGIAAYGLTQLFTAGPRLTGSATALMVSARQLSAAAGKIAVGGHGGPGGDPANPRKGGPLGFVRTAGSIAGGIAGALVGGAAGAEAGHMVDEALGSDSGWGELVGGVLGSSVGAWVLSQVGFLKTGFVGAVAKVTSSATGGTEADVITEEPDAVGPNGMAGDWIDSAGKLHVRRRGDGDRLRSAKPIYDPSDRATVGAYETGGGFGGEDYRPVPGIPLPVPRPDLGSGAVEPLAPAAVKLGEAADNLAAKAAEPVRVEGQTEVHIAPIKIDASGMATVPGQTVRAPLNVGSQGSGVGSSLRGSERNY